MDELVCAEAVLTLTADNGPSTGYYQEGGYEDNSRALSWTIWTHL
jgi:hypothetical protein